MDTSSQKRISHRGKKYVKNMDTYLFVIMLTIKHAVDIIKTILEAAQPTTVHN